MYYYVRLTSLEKAHIEYNDLASIFQRSSGNVSSSILRQLGYFSSSSCHYVAE